MNKEESPRENLPEKTDSIEEQIAHIREESNAMANVPVDPDFLQWKKGADSGDVVAQVRVGDAYRIGILVE